MAAHYKKTFIYLCINSVKYKNSFYILRNCFEFICAIY
ncbi:hypothetical protein EV202_10128 [Bacteroides heparinolyticus]|uniref:Uncharacterized protein n=1 Tax=Prevotella heparinolytica TaxID=28113 RepID=A0A4R2LSQ2_9BACE|nr:hypothetical protein EV202_10128 [Bacteroides heparinolyticus]